MGKGKAFALCLGVFLVFAVAATSARADALCADDMVVKVNHHSEDHLLSLPDTSRAGIVHSFSESFANNNGKHLGFSVASANRGDKFGLFKPGHGNGSGFGAGAGAGSGGTIPNPEPAAVFLLGTGLAAVGAYARKKFRKSSR